MSHFLNILCCFVPLGELHLCNSCAIKQTDTSLWRNMQARFANDICQSYCFRAIKLAYWFARNFFREIYVGDTADYSALYCTKEICCRDTNLHYYAKEIKQRFDQVYISFMQYHLTNFAIQTINYTYDKLNQLTSVSNYGNLELKMVWKQNSWWIIIVEENIE